ncbi:PREDICTED: BI1-like protein [Ipomoea nil]|uniref:BI1-like protein n=1 Tax=Ipomoea nil TaxID=35883 RepID=UPI000900B266|nr:PREDICTED: BI1-like protein [Ipomoea nil]
MMPAGYGTKGGYDIEAGMNGELYPGMMENPQMRWAFIRKVYIIVFIQLSICTGVSVTMFFTPAVKTFMRTTEGLIALICLVVLTFILSLVMGCVSNKHPWNYLFLFLFTVAMACMIGVICVYKKGMSVMIAAGLTALIFVALTLYTFWASSRGSDFSFLGPFLICALLILTVFGFMRMFIPMGNTGQLVYGCIGALIFSGFIIYDTDNLIKRFSYDEYIAAAACLFSDIINLFIAILNILEGAE